MSQPEWKKYICRACGLIYDEALGDPDSGIAPGTRFADIPADWVCPLCGVGKADFESYVPRAPLVAANPAAMPVDNGGVVVVGGGMAGWAVVEWECCLKHPEDGAREGAAFVDHHIIRVTERVFDDFAGAATDRAQNRRMLGLEG